MSSQLDIEGAVVEYARPPEERPTSTSVRTDWLARLSAEDSAGWRRGVIEGALGVLGLRLDDGALRELVLADLRRRFGAEHVDRRLRELGGEVR